MTKKQQTNQFKPFEGIQCCGNKRLHKFGMFRRKSDSRTIQRYRCQSCGKTMSNATIDPACWQKKRHLNHNCMMLLASCVSMRRISKVMNLNQKTVARKLVYLGNTLKLRLNQADIRDVTHVQFDELQTIEHSKCKPLSVAMAVSKTDRQILGFHVSKMPATGHLANPSRKKYGPRPDHRKRGLRQLFRDLQPKLSPTIEMTSDECTFYGPAVQRYFPQAVYHQFKGEKSAVYGQGELKRVKRDPLFSINHSFAMLRANINRLIRKTWCTTKKISRLIDHLSIYTWIHNIKITKTPAFSTI